jgi:hypothetical protein
LEYLQYERFPLVVNISIVRLREKTNGSLRKGWTGKERRKNKMKGEKLGERKMRKKKGIQQQRYLERQKCG